MVLCQLPIMLVVESNLGFEAAHNARYVGEANISNVDIAHEASSRSATKRTASGQNIHQTLAQHTRAVTGVRTTNESKEQMYIMLRSALEDRTFVAWDQLITSSDPEEQRKKLARQMHNYSAMHTDPSRVFAQTRRVFTGKAMGEQDDLLIAVQLAVMYRRVFIQNCANELVT